MYEAERLKATEEDYEFWDDDYIDGYIIEGDVDSLVDCLGEQLLHYVDRNLSKKWNGLFNVITENGYIVKYHYLTNGLSLKELDSSDEVRAEISGLIKQFKEDL